MARSAALLISLALTALGVLGGLHACGTAPEGPGRPDDITAGPAGAPSDAARRAFEEGETLINRSEYEAAAARFREAVEHDPDFARAWYRLAWATSWHGAYEEARAAVHKALRLADALPQADRDIFQATAHLLEGRPAEGIPLAESILVDDPENKEALYILSEMYLHSPVHADVARANEAMLILELLDPGFRLIRDHLVLGLTFEGRWPEAATHIERWTAEDPNMVELRYLGLAAANLGEVPPLPDPFTRALDNYRTAVLLTTDQWQLARTAVRAGGGTGYLRSWHLRHRGDLHAYLGELDQALAAYRAAAETVVAPQLAGIPSVAWLAIAELHLLRGNSAAAKRLGDEAVGLQPESPGAHYGAGRLALLDGDRDAAARHLTAIRQAVARSHGNLPDLFAEALEAEILLADGRAEDAERTFERLVQSGTLLHDFFTTDSSAGAMIRDGLARARRALWDQRGEIEALEGLVESGFERLDHPVLYVRALFRLGELYLEVGDDDRAGHYLDRFLDHWGSADWELAEVMDARQLRSRRPAPP